MTKADREEDEQAHEELKQEAREKEDIAQAVTASLLDHAPVAAPTSQQQALSRFQPA